MKKFNLIIATIAISLSALHANAACSDDAQTRIARKLNLKGAVKVTNGTEVETDKAIAYGKNSKEIKEFLAELNNSTDDEKLEAISRAFELESAGEVFIVLRNTNTCELTVFGGDGEDFEFRKIESISKHSIKLAAGSELNQTSVQIEKIKKSIFSNK